MPHVRHSELIVDLFAHARIRGYRQPHTYSWRKLADWKSLIVATQSADEGEAALTFGDPATPEEIAAVESALKIKLPAELKDALQQCNGVQDSMGTWPLYSTDEMITWNQETRNNYADWDLEHPVENAVLFNDIYGTGDMFGICLVPFGEFKAGQVVLFEHDSGNFNAEAVEAADALETFYRKCKPAE